MQSKYIYLLALLVSIGCVCSASPLNILYYGGSGDLSDMDNDSQHSYTFLAAGDSNWQNSSFLSGFDVIVAGTNAGSNTNAVNDLSNSAVQNVVNGGRAVLSQLIHGHKTTGERQLWTQTIEWLGTGSGVGWLSIFNSSSTPYNFTPFAPGVNLGTSGSGNAPTITDPSHPTVAGLTGSDLVMNGSTHATFNQSVVPTGFNNIIVETQAGNAFIHMVKEGNGAPAVPEPATLYLISISLVLLGVFRKSKGW